MRVKLQLVLCSDDGHEETITDLVTLQKDSQPSCAAPRMRRPWCPAHGIGVEIACCSIRVIRARRAPGSRSRYSPDAVYRQHPHPTMTFESQKGAVAKNGGVFRDMTKGLRIPNVRRLSLLLST